MTVSREALIREALEALADGAPGAAEKHAGALAALDGLVADTRRLEDALRVAADALHDAAWVMEGAAPSPPLPPPITFVLPQTKRVEAEVRAALSGRVSPETKP